MIAVSDLGKSFGAQTLFEGVSIQFNPGNRYGLVGANGSGKSTLLRILSGEEAASSGIVSIPKKLRLGVLKQDHFRYEEMPILDVAMMGNQEVWEAMAEKERLLHDDATFESDRYAHLEDIIMRYQGYSLEARAGEILEGLGIPTEVHRSPLSTLSGGFKLRVLLGQVLAADPGALLLDEPTNHLDIVSIRWLEKFLDAYKGLAIVISHDLRFLDNVCTHIADVDYETVTLYTGNYTAFEAAKEAERERKEAEIQKREKQIAGHQAFVDRFRAKATKARQAQSKIKLIEKIVIDKLPESSRRHPRFRFRQRRPSGRTALEIDSVGKAYGDNVVAEGRLSQGRPGRPPGDHRPERHRQVDAPEDRDGRARAGRRQGHVGLRGQPGVLLAGPLGAPRRRPAVDRGLALGGGPGRADRLRPRAPRPRPLHGRRRRTSPSGPCPEARARASSSPASRSSAPTSWSSTSRRTTSTSRRSKPSSRR